MAQDMFLSLEGVEGECSDLKHPGWIEIQSFVFGVTQIGGATEGGRVSFSSVTITKFSDISTPNLFLYAAKGTHIKNAILEVCQATKEKHVCMRIKLGDVVISNVQLGQEPVNAVPAETVQLSFASIEVEYVPMNKEGKPQAARKMNWYLKTNRST